MREQAHGILKQISTDLDGSGPRRERFLRLMVAKSYRAGWPGGRKRALARLLQWLDADDAHKFPAENLEDVIAACHGDVSFVGTLLVAKAEAEARAQNREMRSVRHDAERWRSTG